MRAARQRHVQRLRNRLAFVFYIISFHQAFEYFLNQKFNIQLAAYYIHTHTLNYICMYIYLYAN